MSNHNRRWASPRADDFLERAHEDLYQIFERYQHQRHFEVDQDGNVRVADVFVVPQV